MMERPIDSVRGEGGRENERRDLISFQMAGRVAPLCLHLTGLLCCVVQLESDEVRKELLQEHMGYLQSKRAKAEERERKDREESDDGGSDDEDRWDRSIRMHQDRMNPSLPSSLSCFSSP